ncbi:MAG: hypothetical protein ACPGJU_04940 [Coraliomargarita sp.]
MLRLSGMPRIIRLVLLFAFQCCVLSASPSARPPWDLEKTYNAAPYAFHGQVKSIEVVPEVKTGVMGIDVKQLSSDELPLEEIVWKEARLYTFTVIDSYKGDLAGEVEVYAPKAETRLWSYLKTDMGDQYVGKMAPPDPYARKLSEGEKGLFFVNAFNGSTLPVLVALRSEDQAERGIRILQTYKQTQGVPLSSVIELDDTMQAAAAEQQASELAELEKRYFKLLMMPNLQERRSELFKFIAELGFDGLWSQEEFEAKHKGSFGMFMEGGRTVNAPSRPESGKERLWYECTKEIEKIDMILKARQMK